MSDQPLDAHPACCKTSPVISAIPATWVRVHTGPPRAFVRDPSTFPVEPRDGSGFVTGIHGGLYPDSRSRCPRCFSRIFHRPLSAQRRFQLGRQMARRPDDDEADDAADLRPLFGPVVPVASPRAGVGAACTWIWAAAAMLTFPTAAFAFQLYPELPALLIILAVSKRVAVRRPMRGGLPSCTGLSRQAQPPARIAWFHVRFLLVCLCLAARGCLQEDTAEPR